MCARTEIGFGTLCLSCPLSGHPSSPYRVLTTPSYLRRTANYSGAILCMAGAKCLLTGHLV
jgi:hypothetical protein